MAGVLMMAGFVLSAAALAQDTTIEDFYGRYKGAGVAQNAASTFFDIGERDLDVEVGAAGEGFFIVWTTVIRDVTEARPRRRTSRIGFVPADRPDFFREDRTGEPVSRGVLRWAHLRGDTLTVQVLAIPAEGGFALQTYERTLVDSGAMLLRFVSVADGGRERVVTGRLTKQ